jgi:hypothetical protein
MKFISKGKKKEAKCILICCFIVEPLSVQNIKELNNLGKYLYVAKKIRNS